MFLSDTHTHTRTHTYTNKHTSQANTHLSDLREQVLHAPNLPLAPQAILAAKLELLVETLLFEGTAHRAVRLSAIGSE